MDVAMKSWELDNSIKLVDPSRDSLYNYDPEAQQAVDKLRPWTKDPNYFRSVRISAVALIKMVMHARSGGALEVMGMMQGYVDGTAFVVTDAFRLPVEGTETRVNAHDEANEYMVEYLRLGREQGGRPENVVGWYHSHPGYGCWLSGIDVGTQFLQQQYTDPFVAVVIDPYRTISAGKVEIGAFRTYPDNYKPSAALDDAASSGDGYQTVPLAKAEDFGAHASRYYALETEHFKSTLDAHLLELLWNKYWVQTLSQSPLITNRDYGSKQMLDLGSKIRDAVSVMQRSSRTGQAGVLGPAPTGSSGPSKAVDAAVDALARDAKQVAASQRAALMAGEIKAKVFNTVPANPMESSSAPSR